MYNNQRVYCLKCQSFECSPYCSTSFIKESDINHENNQPISMDDSDSDFIPSHDVSDDSFSIEDDDDDDDNDDNDDNDNHDDEDTIPDDDNDEEFTDDI